MRDKEKENMNVKSKNNPARRIWPLGLCTAAAMTLLNLLSPASAEDCIPFNYVTVQSVKIGTWKVVDGNLWLMDFGTSQTNANRARDVIKKYKMTHQCFVGRGVSPTPLMYYKVGTGWPSGSMTGQDGLTFNAYNNWPTWSGSSWQIKDCGILLGDFGSSLDAAWEASNLLYLNHFHTKVFVGGRTNPGMTYFLKDQAYRPSISLAVPLRAQETSQWCWAASGKMTMEYLGTNVSQCDQANAQFGRTDCCTIKLCPSPQPADNACVQGGWPDFGYYGYWSSSLEGALSWDDLWKQFQCKKKPVPFSWAWVGGGGHMMVARGAKLMADGSAMVQINDPWAPCTGGTRWITYEAYNEQAGNYTHWRDYYDINFGGS